MEWYVQVIMIVCYLLALVVAGFIGHAIAKREEKKENKEIYSSKTSKLHK